MKINHISQVVNTPSIIDYMNVYCQFTKNELVNGQDECQFHYIVIFNHIDGNFKIFADHSEMITTELKESFIEVLENYFVRNGMINYLAIIYNHKD